MDWSINDPYLLNATDSDLAGYGAVLRLWQRVSALYRKDQVSRGLMQRLLARELGFWNERIRVDNDAALHPPVVNSRLAMALWEIWLQARRPLLRQQVQVTHPQSHHGA